MVVSAIVKVLVACQPRSPPKTGLQFPERKGGLTKEDLKKKKNKNFSLPAPKLPFLCAFKPRKSLQPCRVGHQASSRTSPQGLPLSKKKTKKQNTTTITARYKPLQERRFFPWCDPITNNTSRAVLREPERAGACGSSQKATKAVCSHSPTSDAEDLPAAELALDSVAPVSQVPVSAPTARWSRPGGGPGLSTAILHPGAGAETFVELLAKSRCI